MGFTLPLEEMSNSDKIAVMEEIWDDLCKDPDSVPSPEWHGEILKARELSVREGKAEFHSLDQVKERIKERIK
jgi:hypothetical protein